MWYCYPSPCHNKIGSSQNCYRKINKIIIKGTQNTEDEGSIFKRNEEENSVPEIRWSIIGCIWVK